MCLCVRACICVRVLVCACMRVCARVCVRACIFMRACLFHHSLLCVCIFVFTIPCVLRFFSRALLRLQRALEAASDGRQAASQQSTLAAPTCVGGAGRRKAGRITTFIDVLALHHAQYALARALSRLSHIGRRQRWAADMIVCNKVHGHTITV